MAKIKHNLCLIFIKSFLLCFLVFVVSSDASNSPNSNPNEADCPKLSLVLERLETLENKHQKLEKSHAVLNQRFKSLEKEVEELKSENCVGEDVWLLTPPLRGRRGQKGEKGDSGIAQSKPGEESGQKGDQGKGGPPGRNGHVGTKGAKGEPGPKGSRKLLGRPKNCAAIQRESTVSGLPVHTIYPFGTNSSAVKVMCDFETDGGGWTIIQKRKKGPKEEFSRNWADYSKGFYGNEIEGASGNYWIGLEIIHALTNQNQNQSIQSLRVDLKDWKNASSFAQYSSFSVGGSSTNYRLNVGGYSASSSARDSLAYHNGMQFSTPDRDNDDYGAGSCARDFKAAWWYKYCHQSHLNGLYLNPAVDVSESPCSGIQWTGGCAQSTLQKTSSMKIRDADFTKSLSSG